MSEQRSPGAAAVRCALPVDRNALGSCNELSLDSRSLRKERRLLDGGANCSGSDALNASEADDGNEPMDLPELQ